MSQSSGPFPPALLAHLRTLYSDVCSPRSLFVPLLGAVLSSLNEPELILALFDDACDHLEVGVDKAIEVGNQEKIPDWVALAGQDVKDKRMFGKLLVAVRTREALLKSFPLVGFPLTISSLTALSTHLSKNHPDIWPLVERIEAAHPFPTAFEPLGEYGLAPHPVTNALNQQPLEPVSRGRILFNNIYGKVAGRVLESLRWGHPNLVDSALKLIYTPVLSDTRVLQDPLDSSLLCLALCFASDLPPQTKGHFKGAQNHSATPKQIYALLTSIRCIMEWKGVRLRMERMEFLGPVGGLNDMPSEEEGKPKL
ncbi:hypothetical protein [Phaffia rhodozyma]|uniref:Uncharacterized protein n=1 Tax=Phaffia rhodozyma TaxID=264483 RepID=A0A0F7SFX0_PHARH|nr:hypothetical protein [Phaffia rhodozyma]